ncbi:MAG: response regulator [Ardenticatenales bacterium]|nr:response regulator [Ardenticatenales bacterium]
MSAKTILVIDDDPSVCLMIKLFFERQGYVVETAEDGIDGLGHLAHGYPDLIFLDVQMPMLNGHKVLELLRARQVKIPVLVMSANPDVPSWVAEIGAAGFVPKPFSFPDLLPLVEQILGA